MARKLLLVIVLIFLFYSNAFSQAKIGTVGEEHFSVFWDFYSANDIGARVWAMGGASVANVNDLTAMKINPAAFKFDSRFQIYFEVINKSNNMWLEKYPIYDYRLKSPAALLDFIGSGYKMTDRITTGLGYMSPKYYKLDIEDMATVTSQLSLSQIFIYPYDIFQSKQLIWPVNFELIDGLFLGGNLNYNWMSLEVRGNYISAPPPLAGFWFTEESDVDFLNFKLGALVEIERVLNFNHSGKTSLGLVYTPQKSFETETTVKSGDYFQVIKNGRTILPMKLEIGFKVSGLPIPLNFAGDVKYCDNSKIDNLVDRWDIHLGAEWEKNRNLSFQFGYFSRFDYRRGPDELWLDEIGEYDQHFLTAGVSFYLYDCLLQFSIRDSHLLSSGLIETTQMSVGAGVGF